MLNTGEEKNWNQNQIPTKPNQQCDHFGQNGVKRFLSGLVNPFFHFSPFKRSPQNSEYSNAAEGHNNQTESQFYKVHYDNDAEIFITDEKKQSWIKQPRR